MKYHWIKSFLLLPLLGAGNLYGQAPFKTTEYLDINRFNVGHMLHGDMWFNKSTDEAACEYPKGSGKKVAAIGNIWMIGSDGVNDYGAAQMYRAGGSDFWPGPLNPVTGACDYTTSEQWARIWKVNQSDINTFLALPSKTTATIPAVILEWPAKGNIYAKGNAGSALAITEDMAPFVDTDGDELYNPIKGDYPRIKGEQMLWWVFNDNGATTHTISKGTPFKMECHVSAYAYKRGGILDNVVYYEFDLVNRSPVHYTDFRFGMYSDIDLGYPFDDYIAFDSTTRTGIAYNGTYMANMPLIGVSLVEVPGDIYPSAMQPSGVFSCVENKVTGSHRMPKVYSEFYNYMHGKDADGGPLGYAPFKTGGPYEFALQDGLTMCDTHEPLEDRRLCQHTRGFDFPAGGTKKIAIALMATDTTGNACGALNFKELTDVADSVWKVYYNPLPPLGIRELAAAAGQQLNIYPNPATSVLMIDTYNGKPLKATQLKIYDAAGRLLRVPLQQSSKQIRIETGTLAAGVYSLVYTDEEIQAVQLFVKE